MINSSKNPIAVQSQEWLIKALLELMEHKHYSKITIKEITDKALLSRRTFYRNFHLKDDLLFEYIERICGEYIELLKKEKSLIFSNITKVFFSFWMEYIDFLELLEKNDLFYLLLIKLNEFIPHVYTLFKGNAHEYASEEDLKYVLAFSVGGYWNILITWLRDGAGKSPDELAALIQKALLMNS